MIIGISGKIKSGKDAIGKIIQMLAQGIDSNTQIKDYVKGTNITGFDWEIKKFADKLKDIVCLLINCTREELEDRDFKEKELGEEWWYYTDSLFNSTDSEQNLYSYSKYHRQLKNDLDFYIIKLTPREILQLLGTEAGREIIHPNIWVNALFSEYTKSSNWIITDVRFPNEIKAIKDKGGIVIRVERDDLLRLGYLDKNAHKSETALDDYKDWDYTIKNNDTIEELINKINKTRIWEDIIAEI
jgi:hypothetical protein